MKQPVVNPEMLVDYVPELSYSDKPLKEIVEGLWTPRSVVLADEHNLGVLHGIPNLKYVLNTNLEFVDQLRDSVDYDGVIAVGGCRSLDIGRYFAIGDEKTLINIPTILSTSCLSCNQTIAYRGGEKQRIIAAAPDRTIIPMHELMQQPEHVRAFWTSSGLGDLFSRISAVIDFYEGGCDRQCMEDIIPNIFDAVEFFRDDFREFDYDATGRVAGYLHQASIAMGQLGHRRFNIAGEHPLFNVIVAHQRKQGIHPATHGELVSLGTIVSVKKHAELNGDDSLYEDMRRVYDNLNLPLTYKAWEKRNVPKGLMIHGLEQLKDSDQFLFRIYREDGDSILDAVYGK